MTTPFPTSYPEICASTDSSDSKVCANKKCSFAGTPQPLSSFYALNKRPNGRSWCKSCCSESSKNPNKKQRVFRPAPDGFKICNRNGCLSQGEPQPIGNFSKSNRHRDGLSPSCRQCSRLKREAAIALHSAKFSSPSDVYVEGAVKVCRRKECVHGGVEQSVSNFYRRSISADGLSSLCKDCADSFNHQWRDANPEKYQNSIDEYIKNHQEKIKAYRRGYDMNVQKPLRAARWEEFKIVQLKSRCRKKNIPFDLEPSDLLPLPKFCSVFGIPLDYAGGEDRRFWASIDRIKPSLGYVKGNVRVISMAANMAKMDGEGDIVVSVPIAP